MNINNKHRFIAIILILMGLFFYIPSFSASDETSVFVDVPKTHPYFLSIKHFKNTGIIMGDTDGTFKPAKKISKVEALKIVLTVSKTTMPTIAQAEVYPDVLQNDWFSPYVAYAKTEEIVKVKCLTPAGTGVDFHKITDQSNLPFPTITYKGEN